MKTPAILLSAAVFALAGAAFAQHVHGGGGGEGQNPDAHATEMAFNTFAGGCAPNLSKPEVMQLVLADIGLQKANERVTGQIPHENSEHVWVLPHPGVGVVAVWKPDATRCRVLMQRGDLDQLKQRFSTLLTDTAKPGLAVDKVKETTDASAADGPVETLAYEVYATPRQPGADDRLYTLTLYRGDAAKAQAVIESRRLNAKAAG